MRARVVEAQPEHVEAIVADARHADVDELFAATGITPELAMWKGLACSTHAWTGFFDDRPVCMFGVAPRSVLSGRGYPWLIGTNLMERHALVFLRECRPNLEQMKSAYNLLENYVDARNVKAVRWLRWLGFDISPAAPYGDLGLPFHYFKMEV